MNHPYVLRSINNPGRYNAITLRPVDTLTQGFGEFINDYFLSDKTVSLKATDFWAMDTQELPNFTIYNNTSGFWNETEMISVHHALRKVMMYGKDYCRTNLYPFFVLNATLNIHPEKLETTLKIKLCFGVEKEFPQLFHQGAILYAGRTKKDKYIGYLRNKA